MRLWSTGMGVKMFLSEAYITAGEKAYYLLIEYQITLLIHFSYIVHGLYSQVCILFVFLY